VPLDTVSCFIIEIPESDGEKSEIRILPQGEVGELAVGGHQLATGYINRPEQTKSVFIDSPFGRIYRTGDKARLLPNGKLECFGRLSDGQVKLRGQRLELGEVEQAVLRTSGCHSAVAAVVRSILVVFCAVDAGVTEDTILKQCGDWLPQYMVPGEVVLMSEFPRLPSGKVDRKRLKAEYEEHKAAMSEDSADSEPVDGFESGILAVVSRVMNFKVNKSTPLAAIGMDSLNAIKLASGLRNAGYGIDTTILLTTKTVSDIVFAIRRQIQNQAVSSLPVSANLSLDFSRVLQHNTTLADMNGLIEDMLPCTPLQAAMLAETSRNPTAYCNQIELTIPLSYSAHQISESFVQLSQKSAILRSGFAIADGRFVTLVYKKLRPEQIKVVDRVQSDFSLSSPQEFYSPMVLQIQRDSVDKKSRVLLQIHHSLYDGWSMDVLLSDWSKLLLREPVSEHPSFQEIINFYQHQQTSDDARVFWTENLAGWKQTPLPKLRDKLVHSREVLSVRRALSLPRSRVTTESQRNGFSPQVLFQASLALLWTSITGARDITIGSVTSGRTIPVTDIEQIIGPCIASLPVRVDFDKISVSLDLLNSIHSSNRKIMQYCTVPLSEVKKLVGLQPGESLYDLLFVYQESLASSERTHGVVKETAHLDRSETPILFEVEPTEDGFTLQVTYHEAIVPTASVQHMIDQFESLAHSILERPTQEIKCASRDIKCTPSIDNINTSPSQRVPDLARLFEDVVRKSPEVDALLFSPSLEAAHRTIWSFRELNDYANQIARYLQSCGIGVGQVVAMVMEKSPALYASILAVIKCGCGYLPILPSTPLARTREILLQAEIEYCLADKASCDQLPSMPGLSKIIVNINLLNDFSTANLDNEVDGSRLAYVIYTSGTTGSPKGVAIQQQSIVANIEHLEATYPKSCNSQGRLLQACSQAFDVSVFEIFYTWCAGMCLCAGTNDTILEDIERSIRDLEITHLSMTPTVAALVNPSNVPSVRFLVTAGEPMTQAVHKKWCSQLWQGYGPSETTNICTVKKMAVDDYIEHLGHVFPNTSVAVLFPETLDTVPINWVGEFCFGGAQVAQGYLNMPELTAQKFIQHPQYGRLYRSGDMGRMLPDGSLVILGRIDDQVKLRGQRIEIGEINSTVTMAGFASSAATVLVQREESSTKQLVLFFVPQHDPTEFRVLEIDNEAQRSLAAHIESRLPGYMVPSYLVPISSMPMTSSGKVDKRRLHACFNTLNWHYLEKVSRSSGDAPDEDNWSQVDLVISEAIKESVTASVGGFGRWTPFAILGVDSISAIDLARTLSTKLGTRVAVSDILRNPTIAQLARYLEGKTLHENTTFVGTRREFFPIAFTASMEELFTRESKTIKDILPCTPLQEAMLSRGQIGYYNKVLLRLKAESGAIRSYWEVMSKRHDILRTCFATTADSKHAIAQIVLKDWEIPWRTFDISEPSFDGAVEEHLKSLPDPVDSRTPPVSLALLRYRGSAFLSFICHHALYDGVAMERLLKEVEALAHDENLPPPVSYKEFLEVSTNLPDDTKEFWQQHFQGYRASSIFTQSSSSEVDQSTCTTSLDIPLTDLQRRLRGFGTTLLSVCQASWATVLAMAYRQSDVCFGNVMSGRTLDIDGLERLVAPCFNTIPIRVDLPTTSSNIDMVKHLQKLNTDLLTYQFTPLRLIQRSISRTGKHIFDTLLLLQKPLQDIDQTVWTLEGDSGDMDIPLVCEIVPCPGLNSLIINLHRDMSIVTEEVASAMADAFKVILKAILTAPHSTPMAAEDLPDSLRSILQQLQPRYEKKDNTGLTPEEGEEWSEVELEVRQVLTKLSGVSGQQIQRRTTIFQLGLDSINAVQVASILRQRGFIISASDVIECPSCSKIAAKLLENRSRTESEDMKRYNIDRFSHQVYSEVVDQLPQTATIEAVLPCTPLQSAMLASFIQSRGENYLNAMEYVVTKEIPLESLENAWKSLHERHPMLRTGFVPVQHPDASFAMVRYAPGSMQTPLSIAEPGGDKTSDLLQLKGDTSESVLAALYQPPWTVVLAQTPQRTSMKFVAHHALYDAPGLQTMLDDLSRLVKSEQLPPVSRVEPAVSAILGNSLNEQEAEKAFWEAKASSTVVNKFPLMTPLRIERRCMLADTTMATLSFTELKHATQASNVTIQAVIQAAWTRVLASYLGENAVVFGVTLSGRTTDETRDAAFPCLNTVPVVASNVTSNAELVSYMMEYNQHLHKHQFSPLGKVQKWLGHPASPVFDTLIAYQKMPDAKSSSLPWKLVKDEARVEYPVSLEIEPTEDDSVRLCITYYDNTLPREQAQLLLKQFDASLSHIACNYLAAEDEAFHLSSDLYSVLPPSHPVLDAPVRFLHQFVELGAVVHPTKLALEFVSAFDGDTCLKQQWDYRQLNIMGNKVANMLQEKLTPGSIVAIYFDKCPEAYFSILGILKAGCSFVALDPSAPMARKQFIIEDSKAPCLLTRRSEDLDFEAKTAILEVEVESLSALKEEELIFQPAISPSDTCYCLYTSGTTGTPKGCEITHDNAVQAMMAFQELFKGHWDEESRWLQFAALHFDVSVLEQYWSWSVGMAVVAAPKDLILDDLTASINKLGITHIDLTPSLARLTHPDEIPSLCRGVFITGGEQLKQEILDVWGPKAVIYNAYGPTEATIGVTMFQRVPVNGRPSNIGKQFPNVGSFVFKQNTNTPVLRGGVGELCVSGRLVGKGYLNRPRLTEERFPTLGGFDERVYRTGDLVRVLHDGCFDFLGRADDQVKLRGQRLEIAEINHIVRTDVDEIHDAATIVAQHGASGKDVLVTFVVGKHLTTGPLEVMSDEEGLATKAKEACRAKLPGYMVPTYILSLPYIPLSSNNKAEIKDLKRLFSGLAPEKLMELSHATTTPVSHGAQNILASIYDAMAQFTNINKDDFSSTTSIFDVGVDSITALRLASLLKSRGFHAVSPAMLLKNPVIGDLANSLAKAASTQRQKLARETKQSIQAYAHRHRGLVCRSLNVGPADIEYIAPCSPLQQGIISRSITGRQPGAYFNTFQLKPHQTTTTTKLQQAWKDLVLSESILRTAFVPSTDGFLQVALRNPPFPWVSSSFGSDELVEDYLAEQKGNWIQRNESSITQPLLLTYVETPTSRFFVVHIFHALYDGNSFDLMMDRVAANYAGAAVAKAPPFFEALASGPLTRHDSCRGFWEKHLEGWIPSSITAHVSSAYDSVAVAQREMPVSNLEAIRSSQNVTLQAVVMALWTSVLQSLVQSQITIGVVVSGRAIDLPGVENTVGPLFNTVPFYRQAVHHEDWKSLVRRCHDFNASVFDFQHVPLKDIQKWCSHGKALFDTLFTYQIEAATTSENELPFEVGDSQATPDYPLALEAVYTQTGKLRFTLVAQEHVVSQSILDNLLNEIERFADLAAKSPESEVPVPQVETPLVNHFDGEVVAKDNQNSFEWTPEAQAIQNEISLLADVNPADIAQDVSILELGLDSIDVIKLAAKLKRKSINLAPSQIMRHQTIAKMVTELASLTNDSLHSTRNSSLMHIEDKLRGHLEASGTNMNNVESVLPPTHSQESMIAGMIHSDFESYFSHDVLRVSPHVDTTHLIKAWKRLIHLTPILRTGFCQVESQELDMTFCQVVSKSIDINFEVMRIQDLSELNQITDAAKSVAKSGRGEKQLFQLKLASIDRERYVVLSIAHALYDGWSLSLLFQDLQTLLDGRSVTRPPVEPFIARVLDSASHKAKEFWMQYLQDAPSSTIPTKVLLPTVQNAVQRFESVSNVSLVEIDAACKKLSVSLQVLCQACWAVTLARQIKSIDVTFGTVLSGRDFDGADSLVFPTMNTVALRCILHGSASEFLRYLEENMADIRDFQHYPLRKAQSAAKVDGQDLFNTLFILQKSPVPTGPADRPLLTSVEGSSSTEYPLCVEAEAVSDSLVWRLALQPQCSWDGGPHSLFEMLDSVMSFLLNPNAPEILSFGELGVSICGTPPVALSENGILGDVSSNHSSTDEKNEWTRTERGIREVLHQVSSVPISSIKVSDNLYHLGLDSISAIKVSSLLRAAGISLRPQDLIKSLSISEMARKAQTKQQTPLQTLETTEEWVPPVDIDVNKLLADNGIKNDDAEVLPALPMQVYMLTAWQKSDGSVFFPEFPCRIKTSASSREIDQAWGKLVSETPLLRTCFASTQSSTIPFIQIILKKFNIPLSSLQSEERSNCCVRPLIEANIKQEDKDTWLLRLKLHHALYDGVSLPALLQRLSGLLNRAAIIEDKGLSQWKQFAIRRTADAVRAARREFWTAYLKGSSPNPIITNSEVDVKMRTSHFDRSAISDISHIQVLTAQSGVSFQSLFLAAYARALAKQSNVSDVVFGMYLANRAAGENLPQTYPTLNLVPIRVNSPVDRPLVVVAADIQRDIHQITSDGQSEVGIWEITQWTGIGITSFVNFLTLPSDTDPAVNSITVLSEQDTNIAIDDGVPDLFRVPSQESIVSNEIPVSCISFVPSSLTTTNTCCCRWL
jgi:amino acid adenylation domain-containing protein